MIKIEKHSSFTQIIVQDGDFKISIDVYHPRVEFGHPAPAKINWPCTGSQTVEITESFIKGLEKAIKIAKELNK